MLLNVYQASPMAIEYSMNSPNSGFTFMCRVEAAKLDFWENKANKDEIEQMKKIIIK